MYKKIEKNLKKISEICNLLDLINEARTGKKLSRSGIARPGPHLAMGLQISITEHCFLLIRVSSDFLLRNERIWHNFCLTRFSFYPNKFAFLNSSSISCYSSNEEANSISSFSYLKWIMNSLIILIPFSSQFSFLNISWSRVKWGKCDKVSAFFIKKISSSL